MKKEFLIFGIFIVGFLIIGSSFCNCEGITSDSICDPKYSYKEESGAVDARCNRNYNNNCAKCGNHCSYLLNRNGYTGNKGHCREGPRPPTIS